MRCISFTCKYPDNVAEVFLTMDVFQLNVGDGPLVAAAIHAGHAVRPAVAELLALDDAERLREEDPWTDELATVAPTWLIGRRSRFEMDLNRPREQAVYAKPEDAWGLTVWRRPPPEAVTAESLANYDLFYATARSLIEQLLQRRQRLVVLDLHSYNHCRDGAEGRAADAAENPEINVGTGSLDRAPWGAVVDRFVADLRAFDFRGRSFDVRENVRFVGGHFPRWIHATFPGRVCAIAVEFKKTFMDEWSGELDRAHWDDLKAALAATLPGLRAALNSLGPPAHGG